MNKVRGYLRRFRLWTCRKRGHNIVTNQVVFSYQEPDRYVDGKIVRGDSYEIATVKCEVCGR